MASKQGENDYLFDIEEDSELETQMLLLNNENLEGNNPSGAVPPHIMEEDSELEKQMLLLCNENLEGNNPSGAVAPHIMEEDSELERQMLLLCNENLEGNNSNGADATYVIEEDSDLESHMMHKCADTSEEIPHNVGCPPSTSTPLPMEDDPDVESFMLDMTFPHSEVLQPEEVTPYASSFFMEEEENVQENVEEISCSAETVQLGNVSESPSRFETDKHSGADVMGFEVSEDISQPEEKASSFAAQNSDSELSDPNSEESSWHSRQRPPRVSTRELCGIDSDVSVSSGGIFDDEAEEVSETESENMESEESEQDEEPRQNSSQSDDGDDQPLHSDPEFDSPVMSHSKRGKRNHIAESDSEADEKGATPPVSRSTSSVENSGVDTDRASCLIEEDESERELGTEDRKISGFSTPPSHEPPKETVSELKREPRIILERLRVTEGLHSYFPCSVCSKLFKSRVKATEHSLAKHRGFNCNHCNMQFLSRAALYEHQFDHRNTGRVQCGICFKNFATESTMRRHRREVHEKKRPIRCRVCRRSFARKSDMERHAMRHNV